MIFTMYPHVTSKIIYAIIECVIKHERQRNNKKKKMFHTQKKSLIFFYFSRIKNNSTCYTLTFVCMDTVTHLPTKRKTIVQNSFHHLDGGHVFTLKALETRDVKKNK